ncbi:hypothetical protein OG874_17855 [Nocardia sp. NBC_00565]|uniref:hypothetical protein n=1 Tax=Nocardia sp. NBC_00565 TaxID=2975993 RepID=UPI002E80866F|nr:hypothetical protein [Nocardia sp. NBC_00565]WUC06855.1 hypothetical protein OG874_17855 [Nocardia sp. NBC_00565]
MVQVNTIFVVHTTKNETNAGSDANFELEIERQGGGGVLELSFPDLKHDDRAQGRTDSYRFDVSKQRIDSTNLIVNMQMLDTNDGWLPESIFVIGITSTAAHVLLGSHPNWPSTRWFDRNDSRYQAKHRISGFSL